MSIPLIVVMMSWVLHISKLIKLYNIKHVQFFVYQLHLTKGVKKSQLKKAWINDTSLQK